MPFRWCELCVEAFEELKLALTSAHVLTIQHYRHLFIRHTDASQLGLGAVIYQGIRIEKRVLAYASRCLVQNEKVYTVTEIETLAVIWAIKKFRHYLLGREFVLVTDHDALCSLQTMKDPKEKLVRWLLELSEHRFTVIHKSGVLHVDADTL